MTATILVISRVPSIYFNQKMRLGKRRLGPVRPLSIYANVCLGVVRAPGAASNAAIGSTPAGIKLRPLSPAPACSRRGTSRSVDRREDTRTTRQPAADSETRWTYDVALQSSLHGATKTITFLYF